MRDLRRVFVCAALALAAGAAGCAKKGPPTGGPPDLDPPRIVSTTPDSGAAGVSAHTSLSITFSEGMEPRSSGDAIELLPDVPIRQRRWAGRTLTLVLGDTLKSERTYTMYVGGGARDRHGNALRETRTVLFTTAKEFPPGGIEGRIDAVGFGAPGTMLWLYRDGHKPDSTAKDFDALGSADASGRFRIDGLAVDATWSVYAFADLNRNRSFEPDQDLLVRADTVYHLTATEPRASGIVLHVVNPRAPGRFAGSVLDSVSDGTGLSRLIVVSLADTTRRLLYDVPANGSFDFKFDPGRYRVRAFRDLDRNKAWKRDVEPVSPEREFTIEPGGDLHDVLFVLVRAAGAPADSTRVAPVPDPVPMPAPQEQKK